SGCLQTKELLPCASSRGASRAKKKAPPRKPPPAREPRERLPPPSISSPATPPPAPGPRRRHQTGKPPGSPTPSGLCKPRRRSASSRKRPKIFRGQRDRMIRDAPAIRPSSGMFLPDAPEDAGGRFAERGVGALLERLDPRRGVRPDADDGPLRLIGQNAEGIGQLLDQSRKPRRPEMGERFDGLLPNRRIEIVRAR